MSKFWCIFPTFAHLQNRKLVGEKKSLPGDGDFCLSGTGDGNGDFETWQKWHRPWRYFLTGIRDGDNDFETRPKYHLQWRFFLKKHTMAMVILKVTKVVPGVAIILLNRNRRWRCTILKRNQNPTGWTIIPNRWVPKNSCVSSIYFNALFYFAYCLKFLYAEDLSWLLWWWRAWR